MSQGSRNNSVYVSLGQSAKSRQINLRVFQLTGNPSPSSAIDKCLTEFDKPGLAVVEVHDGRYLLLRNTNQGSEVLAFTADPDRLWCALETEFTRSCHDESSGPFLAGESPSIISVLQQIDLLSRVDSNVLITGETGTGKDLAARMIHLRSARSGRAWVTVNCAAIPDSLLESEMFGHQKGAFTGADTKQIGKMEQANEGTLFLDEIGELSLTAQAKLLRVLETREIQPLGSAVTKRIDFRLIAATNQNLAEMVREKRFRADLFYRLSVAQIHLPSLRERPEDIPALAQTLLQQLNRRFERQFSGVSDPSLAWMSSHAWPGNVRELRCVIESAFVYSTSQVGLLEVPRKTYGMLQSTPAPVLIGVEESSREDREKLQILDLLHETHWNKAETARQMNWSRMTLYRKLRKYQLDESRTSVPRAKAAGE